MKFIKEIEFVFENCESFKLDSKYFGRLYIGDIREKICRVACNAIEQMKTAHEISIELFKDIKDIEYLPFGFEKDKMSVFDRLVKFRDITSIHLHYEDGTDECIYTLWSESDDYTNEYQKNFINNYGNLYIVISKDSDIFDCFDKDEINNKKAMEQNCNMVLVE